jgi:hypothetical protein
MVKATVTDLVMVMDSVMAMARVMDSVTAWSFLRSPCRS